MDLYPVAIETVQIPVTGSALLTMPVEVSLLPRSYTPVDTTVWTPGSWMGEPSEQREVEVTLAGRMVPSPPQGSLRAMSKGHRVLWLRFIDGTDRPVRPVPGEVVVF